MNFEKYKQSYLSMPIKLLLMMIGIGILILISQTFEQEQNAPDDQMMLIK